MMDFLEAEMGFPLLIRNKDRIVPTENGKKILYYCYQIIKNETYLRETVSSINGLLEGTIHIDAYKQSDNRIPPSCGLYFFKCLSQY